MGKGKTGMQRIGRYEVVRELGRGGFGRVYEAFDPTVARPVAIKILSSSGDADLLARFRNEAATAGRLRHHNIVTIYDFGEHEGAPYLVMELLEGEDLQRAILERRQLSTYGKVRIFWEIADALKHAHAHGIVHRDIKPANIMLLSENRIRLLDFGIAWVARTATSRLTPQGNVIGTCNYMAPEQFRGDLPDARADIFAYGIVCYELLTGVYPFHAADPAAIIYRIVNDDPAPLSTYSADFPPALEAIVMRALEKDREVRYQSLEDIQLDLEPTLIALKKEYAASVLDKAERQFSAGETEAAHALIREALELDSASTAGRRLRDQIQREMQRRAIRPKLEALIDLAQKKLAAREFDGAIHDLESALRLDSTNSELRQKIQDALAVRELHRQSERDADLARRAFRERNLTGALAHTNDALLADPENSGARQLLGEIHAELARRELNRRILELLGRTKALLSIQRFDQAVELLKTADVDVSETSEIREMFARVEEERAAHEREVRLVAEMRAAREMIRGGETKTAIDMLIALQAQFPHTSEVRDLLECARQQSRVLQTSDAIDSPVARAGHHVSSSLMRWTWGRRAAVAAIVLALSAETAGTLGGHSRAAHSHPLGPAPAKPAPTPPRKTGVQTGNEPRLERGAADNAASRHSEKLDEHPMRALPTKEAPEGRRAEGRSSIKPDPAVQGPLAGRSSAAGIVKAPEHPEHPATPMPSSLNAMAPAEATPRPPEEAPAKIDSGRPDEPVAPTPPPASRRSPEEATLPAPRPLNTIDSGADSPAPTGGSLNAGPALKQNSDVDRQQILNALGKFEQALANRSLAQVDAAWPEIPRATRDGLQRAFRDQNIRYRVRLTVLNAVSVNGDLATVDCERTAQTTVAGTSRPDQITRVKVTLKRMANAWVIQSIEDLH